MLNLIPFPSGKVNEISGFYAIPEELLSELADFEPYCIKVFAKRMKLKFGEGSPWLQLVRVATLEKEGYQLEISESGITIHAATETGVIWALTTVVCLVENQTLPCCSIEDAPKYRHRSLHFDSARHFFPAQEIKKIIEEISLAKMNVLKWHLTDDQGWRIESKRFPKLHETSGDYFTQDEIHEIVEYAHIRGVEVVPEIDMPGHTSSIVASYPEHSCSGKEVSLATGGGIYPIILCPGKEQTFTFIKELLDEIIPLFPGERFHIGGDEAPKTEWEQCPHCKKRMEELGLSEFEELQGYFTERVNEMVKTHGKQAICWNETLLANNYPKDIQIQYWTLQHRESMQSFVEQGGQWIYSDMFEVYFDYPYSMSSVEKVYQTVPHLGPEAVAEHTGLQGMEACMWTEHVTECRRLEELLFPRVYALAEICWCSQRDYGEFRERLKTVIKGTLHQDIAYTDENWWEPKGRARRKEAIDFFVAINAGMSKEVRKETVKSTKPNREFGQGFIQKFFKMSDLPSLLIAFIKK